MVVRVGRRFGVALSLSGGHDDRFIVLCLHGCALRLVRCQGFGVNNNFKLTHLER